MRKQVEMNEPDLPQPHGDLTGYTPVRDVMQEQHVKAKVRWRVMERPLRVTRGGSLIAGTERRAELAALPADYVPDPAVHFTPPFDPHVVGLRGLVLGPAEEGSELVAFGADHITVNHGLPMAPYQWRTVLWRTPTPDGKGSHREILQAENVNAHVVAGEEAWAHLTRWPWADVVAAFADDPTTEAPIRAAAAAAVLCPFERLPLEARARHILEVVKSGALPGFDAAACGILGVDYFRERVRSLILTASLAQLPELVATLSPAAQAADRSPVAVLGPDGTDRDS